MKKFAFVPVLLFISSLIFAQSYNNEWIDYNKTYYKFKVGRNGLYRITALALSSIGLSNEPVQNIQVWRNGKEVPLYTSAASGSIGQGYIEFWGQENDGVIDKNLYRRPEFQLSDKVSLQTDTASFFLTVNPSGSNLRFINTANNVAGNTLPAETYFNYTLRFNFKNRIHRGEAEIVGEYLYSSSYDRGEMWSSGDIYPGSPLGVSLGNLFVASAGPSAALKVVVAGSSVPGTFTQSHNYRVELNGRQVIDTSIFRFNAQVNSGLNIPLSNLSSNVQFTLSNYTEGSTDRIVCSFFELTYPRSFNFGNQANFAFTMPASTTAKYLEIANFNSGSTPPVLYDLTNNRRYVADVSAGITRIILLPSATEANMVLVSQDAGNITPISLFQQRNFINFTQPANQGDYLIISHASLQAPFGGADQVEQYRAYRSSAAGGGYSAKVYDIDQLVDQFAFGIKKHPLSIKNFLRFARRNFSVAPKSVFLLGKGITYAEYRENQAAAFADRLNLVPTWGYPASDILLTSDNMEPVMSTPIGRLSAVFPSEVADYLNKVKQYEQAQANNTQTIDNKAWMKTVVHVAGGNDPGLDVRLASYLGSYERTIKEPLFGGNVVNFTKTTTGPATTIVNALMEQTFEKGISLLTYFGHSSASKLDYNLDDPQTYNNPGKYPVFLVNGCSAGNLYSYDTSRFINLSALSEIFVLAKNRGSIGFIASTSFGLENYLDTYTGSLYRSIGNTGYGKPIGFNMSEAATALLSSYVAGDFGARIHAEQTVLNGDPAIRINSHPKPDFVVEEPQIKLTPNIISVADEKFSLKVNLFNIGQATGDSVTVQIKRQYPDGTTETIVNRRIKSVRYLDSIVIEIPIVALRDKGENKLTVTIDPDNLYSELSELNNTAAISFSIFEDEVHPVYPYNLSIVNKSNIKFSASTANPLIGARAYTIEVDTTEKFNSAFKVIRTVNSAGGLIEFDAGMNFTDSTVYYWRVAPVPSSGPYRWNNASFVYLNGSEPGYNQSHYYQHLKSANQRIYLDSADRKWKYLTRMTSFNITHAIYPVSGNQDVDFSISLDGAIIAASACLGHSVIFNIFDPVTMKPYFNQAQPSTQRNGDLGGFMKSAGFCKVGREYNFEFSYMADSTRKQMSDFMNWIPSGSYVTARLIYDQPFDQNPFAKDWKNDNLVYGAGNSFYDKIKNAGFADIDSFNRSRTWAFIYKKNDPSFQPKSVFSEGLTDRIVLNINLPAPDTLGYISSPKFGPAVAWKQVRWRGSSSDAIAGDVPVVSVIGINNSGREDTLYKLNTIQQNFDISTVSAVQYPYIKLAMRNADSVNFTPYQLRYWRVLYTPVPEGALAPTLSFKSKDTLEIGEKLDFSIAFKNISDVTFADSLKVKMIVFDKNNVPSTIPIIPRKKLAAGDTTNVSYSIDTRSLEGNNTLYVNVNPDLAQPEQFTINNFLYKNFFVKGDVYNPLLDVTFDGVHILNGDIVSARPRILIKLKDEAKYLALDDTSLATVFIRYPGTNGALQRYTFGTDTLRFIPADISTGKNEAMIEFTPAFLNDSDGDYYELIVKGKDKSGNAAGSAEYRVRFQVYNKPMISNMLNYPNPFTSSTAFVFTVTGSQVPQNIRIQVLTVTGKIVREITKDELGPLHIGRNITEFKWDGTDQYGQKLGNGIYLYRVITNLNGNPLDKFSTMDANGNTVDTDKYFNKGYGKMYLMR